MSDYLYKAFTPSVISGKEQIYLNGRTICGKWVYGNGVIPVTVNCNKTKAIELVKSVNYDELDHYASLYESNNVIPETICAAIPGLKDKNGKQVFNHDLVTIHEMLGVYEVRWTEAQCRYDLYLDGCPVSGCNQDTIKNYEVIGTIFDK